jgi:ADP-ribose pyrophosphatase YjhB (NUDIX family)
MESSAVRTFREGPRYGCDEQQDTGFNIEEFAVVRREDSVCAAAVGTLFSGKQWATAPPIPSSSNRSLPPGFVHDSCTPSEYRRPQVVVRCIAQHAGGVLLCQRADEPRRGFWNTPGGFLENGETLRAAVIRETLEESGVSVHAPKLAYIHKLPQLNQIVMTFLAEVRDSAVAPGEESLDARLFAIDCMPWSQLAFPTDSDALRRTFQHSPDRQRRLQIVECVWDADGHIFVRQR